METDIKNTVAMEPRRIVTQASAHQSGPVVGRSVANTSNQTGSDSAVALQGGTGNSEGSASLEQALQDLNGYVQNVQRNLQFDVDDDSGHTVIRVVDSETDEVIRQIPSEEVLALARHLKGMNEAEQGLFLKEKA